MLSLTEIAESILTDAKRLDAYLSSKGLPSSSFERDTFNDLPGDLAKFRDALLDSTQTLKQLTLGPVGMYIEVLFSASANAQVDLQIIRECSPQVHRSNEPAVHISLRHPEICSRRRRDFL